MLEADVKSFSAISDNEVIGMVLNGEKSMYELLMRRHNRRLFRIALSILKNETDAEDAVQETYIKAYQHLCHFQQHSLLSTWLIKILINEALLKQKRQRRLQNFYNSIVPDGKLNYLSDKTRSPEEYTFNNELKSVLEQAILDLPENYSEVYIMREIEQMNVEETSKCLCISKINVKVRLNRAKAILKGNIIKAYGSSEIFSFHLIQCNRIVQKVFENIE
jgi:RNA polymerase sigma factor (sigma-70 family)